MPVLRSWLGVREAKRRAPNRGGDQEPRRFASPICVAKSGPTSTLRPNHNYLCRWGISELRTIMGVPDLLASMMDLVTASASSPFLCS